MNRTLRATALLLTLVACGTAMASEPSSLVKATIPNDPGVMPADDIRIVVELTNGYDEPVDVIFDNAKPPALEDAPVLFVWPPSVRIPAAATATVEVVGRAPAAGKFAVIIEGAVSDEAGQSKYETIVPLNFRVGDEEPDELVRRGDPSLTARLEDFETLFDEDLEFLNGIGPAFAAEPGVGGIPEPVDPIFLPEEPEEGRESRPRLPRADALQTVKGQYRWKDTNGKIQPAAGWRAALYRYSYGIWFDTGDRATVGNDASFSIPTNVPKGVTTRVVIFPSNRYFDLLNSKAQKYQFVFPSFVVGNGTTYDHGPWWIDLNKSVPGLGELHRSAYDLYSKLMAANFSPLRSKPIRVIYPGTDDCGSCTLNGTVHIEVAKATNNRTIKHELGHELMYQYWGGMPKNSGGYHEWPKCYNEGLALSEGFAHFVSWWANVDRGTLAGSWGMSYNGESLSDSVCKSIGKNELRVAATFWDLHDTKVDGVDLYTNAAPGRIFEMILGGDYIADSYTKLMYPRLETTGGLEWWRIEPISEMNFTN